MDAAHLRFEILHIIETHEATTGSSAYLDDEIMAAQLNIPISDVQRQLLILENRELVELAKAFGPSYAARLTPNGMEALEGANSQPAASARRIGF